MSDSDRLVELIGVYHADGGPAGEARYVVGKLLGNTHCGLCDVTHGAVRRKPEWDAMVRRIGLPFVLLHLNEMRADVAAAVREHGSPVVMGRTDQGELRVLIDSAGLEELDGSVELFEGALRRAADHSGLALERAAA